MLSRRVVPAEDLPIGTNALWVDGTLNPGIHFDPGDCYASQFLYTYGGSDPLDDLSAVRPFQMIHKGIVQVVDEACQC